MVATGCPVSGNISTGSIVVVDSVSGSISITCGSVVSTSPGSVSEGSIGSSGSFSTVVWVTGWFVVFIKTVVVVLLVVVVEVVEVEVVVAPAVVVGATVGAVELFDGTPPNDEQVPDTHFCVEPFVLSIINTGDKAVSPRLKTANPNL